MSFRQMAFVCFCSTSLFTALSMSAKTVNFQMDTSDFVNPEKGFYIQSMNRVIEKPIAGTVSAQFFKDVREKMKISLLRNYVNIDAYVDGPIAESFLVSLEENFQMAREGGFKIIPRVIYNRSYAGVDATLERIQSHIDQVAPVLNRNKDVLAFIEAGFIGMYGEWHDSDQGHDNLIPRKAVLFRLFEKLDPTILVTLRYAYHKRAIFANNNPLTLDEAFTSDFRARTGHTNDCFGADVDDWGTYENAWSDKTGLENQKNYLNKENQFVPQTGETCNVKPPYSECEYIVSHLERIRWDHMNIGYQPTVLQGLRDNGCFDKVLKNLGYRLNLLSATLPDTLISDGKLKGSLRITNTGYGKIYKARHVNMVLRNAQTAQVIEVPIHRFRDKNADPRFWLKNDTVSFSFDVSVPGLTQGVWQMLLSLPDTAQSIRKRPEYSIRLANQGVWEPTTGYNNLQHSLVVNPSASPIRKSFRENPDLRVQFRGTKLVVAVPAIGATTSTSTSTVDQRDLRLDITNTQGKVFYSTQIISGKANPITREINSATWPRGLYLLNLHSSAGTGVRMTKSFIKE